MRTRFAAWLVTGTVGHGYAAVLDITILAVTLARRRLRTRLHRRPRACSGGRRKRHDARG